LRGQLIGIDYVPQAKAVHLARGVRAHQHRSIIPGSDGSAEPRIIVALDRHHFNLLCSQFIPSLRASGNNEVVSVVGYGFYASQQRKLARFPNIDVHSLPISTVHPMMKRLDDFQRVVEQFPSRTPVAFWDAGDAMFQQELKPLWSLILQEPEKFHTVTEPTEDYTESWVCAIQDASLRNSFRRWVSMYGILNGGFGAATASTMLLYLKEANRIYNDLALLEDQTAMNIYCHSDPSRWKRIEEGWNYCLCNRDRREVRFAEDGRLVSTKGTPIYVAHGNGRTFQHYFARSNSRWLARYRAHSAIA